MTKGATRNPAIDFTKGILVLVMVMYHSLDYFVDRSDIYKYIWFVTGAFVFMSGFIISNIYLKKYHNTVALAKRLVSRGIKIVMIFISFNVAVPLMLKGGSYHGKMLNMNVLIDDFYSVFIIGNYRMVIFRILLSIAYLLIIAGILMLFIKQRYWILNTFCLIATLYGCVFYFNNFEAYNFVHVTIGLCGITVGFISIHRVNSLVKYTYLLISLYIVYVLLINKYAGSYYPLYLFGIFINLTLAYLIGLKMNATNVFYAKIAMLGRYSLLSYLTQIIFLQLIHRIVETAPMSFNFVIPSFVIVTILLILCIQIIEHYRGRAVWVDNLYRSVFA